MSNYRIGDRVRYTGTAEQDIYHGKMVGKTGVITQLYPFVMVGQHVVGSIGPWPSHLEPVSHGPVQKEGGK